jgi:hypothetical protein
MMKPYTIPSAVLHSLGVCPHCDCFPTHMLKHDAEEVYQVECEYCKMRGPKAMLSRQAIERWNKLPRRMHGELRGGNA